MGLPVFVVGDAVRKLFQFGVFGLQEPLEDSRLSDLGGLNSFVQQHVWTT